MGYGTEERVIGYKFNRYQGIDFGNYPMICEMCYILRGEIL